MTISSTNRKAGPYAGNDSTTVFPFVFKVFWADDVFVVRADATGAETMLVLDSGYTVLLNADQDANPGGSVTLPAALATGDTLTISSALENLQPTELTSQGGFYPRVITNALDRLTILVQQLAESVSRSLKLAISTPAGVDSELPAPVPYALLGWNEDGSGFRNADPSDVTGVLPILASSADGKGAALVGFDSSVAYTEDTAGAAIKNRGITIKDAPFLATGNGSTNDSAAEISAHSAAAGKGVRYPYQLGESYLGTEAKYNIYGNSVHKRALAELIQAGLAANPTTEAQPVLWVQKVSAANRDTVPTNWDQVGYFGLIKKSGDAYGAALTGYNLTQGGSGDSIGIHGRVDTRTNGSRTYAGWFYSAVGVGVTPFAAHALELNGYNAGVDLGYLGKTQLLRVCMADSSASENRFSTGISVGRTTVGGDNNGFYTGLHFERDSIIRSTGADNEAIRVDAPSAGTGSIGGFRFAKFEAGDAGVFKYALRTDEATFLNNNVLLMATGQGIRWGNESTGVRFLGGGNNIVLGNGFLNITNPVSDTAIQVASTKVLGARKTGWESATGTATRTTFATSTVTTAQLAERVKALIDDLISHGLVGA